ncbi:MAG: hypothetical protein HUU35_00890, partial [Armatimonadetes bacterium]|nr:hypothetical protein [Armatimonadota bacterium]
ALAGGPSAGGWAAVTLDQWRARLRGLGAEFVEYTHPKQLAPALDANEVLAVVNPYGESLPVILAEGLRPMLQRIERYTRAGGNWFEVGGHPFYYALVPASFLSYSASYPPAFADYFHLETSAGRAAVYGVQPQTDPWDRDNLFVPGRIACGGDEQGGWCERPFGIYAEPQQQWRAPLVRLAIGRSATEALADYAAANRITRRLDQKMKPDVLRKFKDGVLVFYTGTAAEKTAHLGELPPSSLIHFSDYLRGGFDKQYPDHLPPRPQFGTAAEFREFIDRARAGGHLIMPYTNPTWWCDDPKGPTFEREGTAPLLKTLDGKVVQERYADNTGFTITMWHPAVQAANRLTRKQFTEEFPVDIMFQDQCGARTWHYDTNPASPSPAAYADGMISLVDEDAAVVPLSTENGWDRVVNAEAQLCGLSWSMVPTEGGPVWRRPFQEDYRPELWRVYPLVQVLAHDKCSLLYHDLGQFVTNPQVASWTLGLGFGMSYRCSAVSLARPAARQWLYWIDRLQKSICAEYVGAGLRRFEHERRGSTTARQDGVIRSAYGPVEVVANLDPNPRREDGRELAGYGFYATAPGTIAARLQRVGEWDCSPEISFVSEATANGAEAWVYSAARRTVAVELAQPLPGKVHVVVDGGTAQTVEGGKVVRFELPLHPQDQRLDPPAELAAKAPREWPGGTPAVGLIDFGATRQPSWTTIKPAAWLAALQAAGLTVKPLRSPAEVSTALAAGVTNWLAIVNPYGEAFPSEGPGQAQAMLAKIRQYVNHGGSWVETGGYSFYQGVTPEVAENLGSAGMGGLRAAHRRWPHRGQPGAPDRHRNGARLAWRRPGRPDRPAV